MHTLTHWSLAARGQRSAARRRPLFAACLFTVLQGCAADGNTLLTQQIYTGYSGNWTGGQSDGTTKTGTIQFMVSNGSLSGTVAPISGSTSVLTGTVNASNVIAATVPGDATVNGCAVTITGQITPSAGGAATAGGTYTLVTSATCKANSGTWSAVKPAGT